MYLKMLSSKSRPFCSSFKMINEAADTDQCIKYGSYFFHNIFLYFSLVFLPYFFFLPGKICDQWLAFQVLDPVSAFIIVDVQHDFICGSLAVGAGDEVVPVINDLIENASFDNIIYSLDWHPSNHISFLENIQMRELHHTSKVTFTVTPITVAYMPIGSSVIQVMAWHLFGGKPLPEPIVTYCHMNHRKSASLKFESKYTLDMWEFNFTILVDTFRPDQNSRPFSDNISQCFFLKWIFFSLKFYRR